MIKKPHISYVFQQYVSSTAAASINKTKLTSFATRLHHHTSTDSVEGV